MFIHAWAQVICCVQILNFIILGGFQKNDFFYIYLFIFFFWGGGGWYKDFLDIFWGPSQNWTIFRGHFYAF